MLVRFVLALVAVLALIWASVRIASRTESAALTPNTTINRLLYS